MATIDWSESVPPTTESAGLGAQRIQSLKTAIRTGLAQEHVWPSAGGDAGVHLLGSARAYYGAQSLVSSSGTDGRLQVTSDSSRLFHVGSAGTMFLGGAAVISAGSQPVGGSRFYWAMEFGEAWVANTAQQIVTFPNSGFSGKPFVWISAQTDGGTVQTILPVIRSVTATQFSFNETIGPLSKWTAAWLSVGTRTF